MDRAARAVRRSSVKLMSLGGGHTDLHVLLSEVKDMRQAAKTFMNAQNAVSQDLLKWAANEENRALQDVANQLAELNLLWTEVQREFGEHIKDYRHMFEMVLEGEKHVSQSRNHFAVCEQREMKIRKELKKAFKKSSSAEIQSLEGRLAQAERAKHLAQLEVTDRVRENEAVKLIRLKEGLMKLSQAYSDFARKCSVVFDAQQDIVQELPDVLDQDLEDLKYTGTGVTRHCVQQAKERVRNYRTRKEYFHIPQKYCEPPPPYSLTNDDFVDPSILCPPVLQSSSPRRRISTATTNTTVSADHNNFDSSSLSSSSSSKQHQQQHVGLSDISSIGSGQHYHLHHHHPHLPPPQPSYPSGVLPSSAPKQGYDPLYPSLPFTKTSCNSSISSSSNDNNNSSNSVVIMPASPQPPACATVVSSSSPSATINTSSSEVKLTSGTTPTPSHPPPPSLYNSHHPSFVALGANTNNSTSSLSLPHKIAPSPFSGVVVHHHLHQQTQQQPQPPQPPPPPPMEAAVPEVPADMRPVISKPPSYDDDEGDDDDCCCDGGNDVDNSNKYGGGGGGNIIIINKEREGGGGGVGCHHLVQDAVVGLVDFQPAWDDSYEEDLSGAMGGAKI